MDQVMLRYFWKVVKIATTTIVIIVFIRSFIIDIGKVNGRSMENTYLDDERFVVNKVSSVLKPLQRGDVIQMIDTENETVFIKRIIGLPGEEVTIEDNAVSIVQVDGTEITLDEPYLNSSTLTKGDESYAAYVSLVPEDHYFVLGDNRSNSLDSRTFGPVHRWKIYGRVTDLSFMR